MPIVLNGSGPVTGVTSLNTTVSDTEIGYLDGVTSALQTQINTAGGLVKITDSTFSAQSSVSINNCFTSTYENYLINLQLTGVATDGGIFVRLRASGSDSSSGYSWTGTNARTTVNTAYWYGGLNANEFYLFQKLDAVNSAIYTCTLNVFGPQKATVTAGQFLSSGIETATNQYQGVYASFNHSTASAYDGFTLHNSAGTFSGTLRVYGYRN